MYLCLSEYWTLLKVMSGGGTMNLVVTGPVGLVSSVDAGEKEDMVFASNANTLSN